MIFLLLLFVFWSAGNPADRRPPALSPYKILPPEGKSNPGSFFFREMMKKRKDPNEYRLNLAIKNYENLTFAETSQG